MINYLDKADIIYINQETIKVHGGNYMFPNNFLYEENLIYLLEIIQAQMFGEFMNPTIAEKASLYAIILFAIIFFQMVLKELASKLLWHS